MKKMLRLTGLLSAVALTAVGCSSGEHGPAEEGKIEGVVQWTMLDYGPMMKDWAEGMAEAFEAEHPGVDVQVTLPPSNSYQQLLTTQVRGDNAPDIAALPTAWVSAFADAGVLVDWTEVVDQEFLGRFEPTLLEGAKFDGALYSLPYLATSRALFWNQGAFAAAGESVAPATWDELIAQGTSIAEAGGADNGIAMQGTGVEAFSAWFPYVYWSNGGELADPDGRLAIDQEACIAGTTVLQRMVEEGVSQPNVTATDSGDMLSLFMSGEAAMTITGPWLIGMLESEAPDIDFAVAPLPKGTTSSTLNVQDAYVLFEGGNTAAAAEFARFLFDPEIADQFVEEQGMLPVLTEGFNAPRYQEGPLKAFVEMLPTGKFVPNDPNWLTLSDVGGRELQAMYTDGKTPEAVCAAIAVAAGS